jgi:hypothetical protein
MAVDAVKNVVHQTCRARKTAHHVVTHAGMMIVILAKAPQKQLEVSGIVVVNLEFASTLAMINVVKDGTMVRTTCPRFTAREMKSVATLFQVAWTRPKAMTHAV